MTTTRLPIVIAVVASMLASATSSAFASLSDEVTAGRATAARVDAGTATCKKLSPSDLEDLGEYVMERLVGSRSAHAAMNARMQAMIGSDNADRMHRAIGGRYSGCATTGSRSATMGGAWMMGSGWGTMMSSGYGWMRSGTWREMARADWQRAAEHMMGRGWKMYFNGSRWSAAAVIGVVLAALSLCGLGVYTLVRRPRRHGPSHPSSLHAFPDS